LGGALGAGGRYAKPRRSPRRALRAARQFSSFQKDDTCELFSRPRHLDRFLARFDTLPHTHPPSPTAFKPQGAQQRERGHLGRRLVIVHTRITTPGRMTGEMMKRNPHVIAGACVFLVLFTGRDGHPASLIPGRAAIAVHHSERRRADGYSDHRSCIRVRL